MKKRFLLLILALAPLALMAQSDSFKFTWHGFVNPVLYGDSRQVVSGREGMMLFFPQAPRYDSEGNDLNAVPSLNLLAITARANVTITGPDVLGAKMRGFIEGDFTGATEATINMFRLRHAYLDMKWEHSSLLMGQYWYPMVIHEIMPMTQPLNMGAPFHPYARYNQVRYTYRNGGLEGVAVAAFQLDNKSQGALGSSTQYLKTSCVPEMNLQLRYHGEHLFVGAAANWMVTRPRTFVEGRACGTLATDQLYSTFTYSLFGRLHYDGWQLKAQTLLNDNIYEGCSLGGFIEHDMAPLNNFPIYEYNTWTYTTVWADLSSIRGKWRPGIFMGYAHNNFFGQELSLSDNVYGRGFDIEYLYRVQPRIEYYAGNGFVLSFELEHTFAQYGQKVGNLTSDMYHYEATPELAVSNTRGIVGVTYAW